MICCDEMIGLYLKGQVSEIESFWLFDCIEEGKHLFQTPDPKYIDRMQEVSSILKDKVQNFCPWNEEDYAALFPDWRERLFNTRVLLAVGCPAPYDAMVRSHEEKDFIIFDLIHILEYVQTAEQIQKIVQKFLTHETAHICIHADYPQPEQASYLDQLEYIAFNEGFAHLLAYCDQVRQADFQPLIEQYGRPAFELWKRAVSEGDPQRQAELLKQANCGSYWGKFAAICGKLFLAQKLGSMKELYQGGVSAFAHRMSDEFIV